MIILLITVFVVWVYLLTVLYRAKLVFFRFMLGAVGIFFFAMVVLQPYLVRPLGDAVALVAGFIGNGINLFEAFPKYALIIISRNNSFISFYIDYECSGFIEMLAFMALLWFYPVYNTAEKAIISIAGILWIFISNVIRILVICAIIYVMGDYIFFFAHTIFGRIVFYAMSIVLYFYVFTKSHIIRQKVGQFTYVNNTNKNI